MFDGLQRVCLRRRTVEEGKAVVLAHRDGFHGSLMVVDRWCNGKVGPETKLLICPRLSCVVLLALEVRHNGADPLLLTCGVIIENSAHRCREPLTHIRLLIILII